MAQEQKPLNRLNTQFPRSRVITWPSNACQGKLTVESSAGLFLEQQRSAHTHFH